MMKFDQPDDAIRALAERLKRVDRHAVQTDCIGRILAASVVADRDSPAADVSAMDGYAIRMSDLQRTEAIPVSGESVPGAPPPEMVTGKVTRIFTGAIVPSECDSVIKREDTEELDEAIRLRSPALSTQPGQHIRRAGENAKSGDCVLSVGTQVLAAQRATMSNFGCHAADVYDRVRVSIVTTGDEVGTFGDESPKPWQLRNSNREALLALLGRVPWISIDHIDHCLDDRDALTQLLRDRLQSSDAILMTGGVSMGDYDYVPDVIRDIGGDVVFHGLPIRPGKPILGAATADGKLLIGLPGNPVSATIGCRRMSLPLLAKIAGHRSWMPKFPVVRLENGGEKTIPLHWMRLVRLSNDGVVQPVLSQGSGDLVSLGQSDGFVELPPGGEGEGPWPYHAWA